MQCLRNAVPPRSSIPQLKRASTLNDPFPFRQLGETVNSLLFILLGLASFDALQALVKIFGFGKALVDILVIRVENDSGQFIPEDDQRSDKSHSSDLERDPQNDSADLQAGSVTDNSLTKIAAELSFMAPEKEGDENPLVTKTVSIAVTDFEDGRIFQRNGRSADIVVSGIYTGTDLRSHPLLRKFNGNDWSKLGGQGNGAIAFGNRIIERLGIPVGFLDFSVNGSG